MKHALVVLVAVLNASAAFAGPVEHNYTSLLSTCKVEASSASTQISYGRFGVKNLSSTAALTVTCPLQIEQTITAPYGQLSHGISGGVCAYNQFRKPVIHILDRHPSFDVACTLENIDVIGAVAASWDVYSSGTSTVPNGYTFNVASPGRNMVGAWNLVCWIPPTSSGNASGLQQIQVSSCSTH
jgi:hypothetical protein